MSTCNHHFTKGDHIEILRNADVPAWFPATVIDSPPPDGPLHVKFTTLYMERDGRRRKRKKLKDYVSLTEGNITVRPVPPPDPHRRFAIGEEVEAFHDKGWRRGKVKEVINEEDSKYEVVIDGVKQVVVVEKCRVRVYNGSSVSSPLAQQQEKSPRLESQSKKVTKLRIICSPRASRTSIFHKGTLVEVKSDKERYNGSWYTALIVESLQNSKFTVEYQTLKTSDGTRLLKEEADPSCIRPIPPRIERCDRFLELEMVDAWYNGGWWVGTVSEVLDQYQYLVYLSTTNEIMRFTHSDLRPHQEWIDLEWFTTLDPKALKLRPKYGRKTPTFSEGTRVEVRSDEEGYHGSWYVATVVGSVGNGKLLVQYDTLTTDDGLQPLVEMAHASNLRPLPPIINRIDRFKNLEEVDAWYNDGWWVGLVSKVLDGLKYVVYFWTTNEESEFKHSKLRPHQELINQKWVASFLRPKMAAKPSLEKVKIQMGGRTLMAGVLRGLKVEIAHGENGYLTTWYPAVILGPLHNGKYLVEYRTVLRREKGRELVKEEVDVLCIRPCPPIIQRADRFQPNDGVDAWDVIGWRCGQIYKTVKDSTYTVYFRATDTVTEFQHADLRPHQDFIDGTWVRDPTVRIFVSTYGLFTKY
ncbi:hypothetical protein OSB04_018910 [Centaurea solstitialis]|uniref:Agenet domain-containing protein n=1 Tax=Centaurea solstitialis TaxID=347529 RepID=A0AA38W2C4_9ASTR|nr:hypothetical protein OSB04_018910 [Centaurea solstitialis]